VVGKILLTFLANVGIEDIGRLTGTLVGEADKAKVAVAVHGTV